MNSNQLVAYFTGNVPSIACNFYAYMSFRALAQSDEDFPHLWVEKFQRAQNPNLQKLQLTTQKKNIRQIHLYHFPDPSLGENATREYKSTKKHS